MTWYGRWPYKFENAAKHGAAAALIVHQTEPAAYPWAVVQSSWTGRSWSWTSRATIRTRARSSAGCQESVAQTILKASGRDLATLTRAAQQKGFKAVPLGLTLSGGFTNTIRRQASKNVIGVLPGTTEPGDYVLYSAHWDHLGRCDAVDGDDICNGALDNATGVAGLVALAEAQVKRDRPSARSRSWR